MARKGNEHSDDPVDDTTPVFTQAEVFWVGGFLLGLWLDVGLPESAVDDTETAIREVLKLDGVT